MSLSGTATLQLPEKAYREGKQIGETEADVYSDTLSVATTTNGKTTDVAANRWQTAPFPWSDPVVISAPITIHPFTVPVGATGAIALTLPRNERRAPNTASSSPATVAFNGVANNKTTVGNVAENLGCYLQGTAPSTIGTIPITSTSSPARSGSTGSSGSSGSTTTSGSTTQQSTGDTAPAAAGAAPAAGTSQEAPAESAPQASAGGATGLSGAQPGVTTMSTQGQLYPTSATTRSGVFISTTVLILIGALACFVALAYAFLTRYRLRSIRQAMDDR